MATTPILHLTAPDPTTRPTVRIDQVEYELRMTNDLTLHQYKTLERISPRIGALIIQETLTEDEGVEARALLDQACRIALDAPVEIHDRLNDVNRVLVYKVFIELCSPSLRAIRARLRAEANPFDGTRPSLDSCGSTGAQP